MARKPSGIENAPRILKYPFWSDRFFWIAIGTAGFWVALIGWLFWG